MIFSYSTDEEYFHDYCEATTIDEARAIAEAELCLEDGQSFYVGERQDVHPEEYLRADRLLEQIGNRMYDEVGELVEDWPDASQEQVAALQAELRAAFVAWMKQCSQVPSFYQVVDVKTFIAGDSTP